MLPCVTLKRGRDGPVRGGSPWVFSQAIERVEPADLSAGSAVELFDANGSRLAFGYYNPSTTIAVRILEWGPVHGPGEIEGIIERRLSSALELRRQIVRGETNCYRLLNGDGDGLSGLVVDRYADVLVMQLLTAGAERMRDQVVAVLERLLNPRSIIERSQGAVRREEGLEDRAALILGTPVSELVVTENGIKIGVDVERGQKTGYFLDQRENRVAFGTLARGARVLDAYCYSAGFTLAALKGGASHVTAIDSSEKALGWARRNLELNCYSSGPIDLIHDDAAKYLAKTSARFDLIVLDPPPLARSRKDAERAERLYLELNALALSALTPHGRLMTFSCSAHVRGEGFVRTVRFAQARAARPTRVLAHLSAGPDHPVLLGHAEGDYLTGLLLGALD
ncbi:MAG TPA: class I SAM-dependent rRNA methyltransferase [Candidatus Binataceae bacterium]|nr:class I SAM-dependent rRNA methyltransferase [Candidatus Binataceae bacterium]